jgi:hypothetical protein
VARARVAACFNVTGTPPVPKRYVSLWLRRSVLNFVLLILIVMLVGSVVSLVVVPPFLYKISDSGQVDFFGIKFLGK